MEAEVRRCRPLLGTLVEIAVRAHDSRTLDTLIDTAFDEIALVHRLMSFHDGDSDVARFNASATGSPVKVDVRTFEVLRTACDLHELSAGAFDIAIAGTPQRLGLLPGQPMATSNDCPPRTGDICLLPGNVVGKSRADIAIDLGGIAKGYAVDRGLAVLRDTGVGSALINAGGDLAVLGLAPWPVAIRNPCTRDRMLCEISLVDGAVASSGGIFDPLVDGLALQPSIVDPRRGSAARALAGATVRAPTCMIADALTKIVMLMGEDSRPLLDRFGASALAVSPSGDVTCSPGWPQGVAHAA